MSNYKVAIIVQVYKSKIDEYERISLRQLNQVLKNYPKVIVCPNGMDTSAYRDLLGPKMDVIFFHPRYFASIKGYNKIMISKFFYKAFLTYDYILLHHTDAFVFSDQLDFWMNKGYDYIGAPIYEYDGTRNPPTFLCNGQGGLSLRKVKTFYDLADSLKVIYSFKDIKTNFLHYNWRGRVFRLLYYLSLFTTLGSRMHPFFNRIRVNEDVIWGKHVAEHYTEFKTAGFEESLKFGMEFNCDRLLKKNSNELPFGCHAWYKPLFKSFWKPHVEKYGYVVD